MSEHIPLPINSQELHEEQLGSFEDYKRAAYLAKENRDEATFQKAIDNMYKAAQTKDELKRTLLYVQLGTAMHRLIEEKLNELESEVDTPETEAA
jgi:hypothetical protein